MYQLHSAIGHVRVLGVTYDTAHYAVGPKDVWWAQSLKCRMGAADGCGTLASYASFHTIGRAIECGMAGFGIGNDDDVTRERSRGTGCGAEWYWGSVEVGVWFRTESTVCFTRAS